MAAVFENDRKPRRSRARSTGGRKAAEFERPRPRKGLGTAESGPQRPTCGESRRGCCQAAQALQRRPPSSRPSLTASSAMSGSQHSLVLETAADELDADREAVLAERERHRECG